MSRATYIIGALAGSAVVAYVCDKKAKFGLVCFELSGTTPGTITNKEWGAATEERLQAWPRVAGPPVVMNPISRQNFIVKSRPE
ncbi:hypothetical protein AtNW77_Chr4g0272521 [Arabidopsis thaliana]|uniref:Uncharacterized protein n=1 Tax=Arabidopsis thaliana TaxID=3702 RepID=A0A5S9XP14_ARATH|nr:unnamed protein product [Arabidopsis thaliana]VYS61425.1 unnamed protein product [Arabidopsis thaliana]